MILHTSETLRRLQIGATDKDSTISTTDYTVWRGEQVFTHLIVFCILRVLVCRIQDTGNLFAALVPLTNSTAPQYRGV